MANKKNKYTKEEIVIGLRAISSEIKSSETFKQDLLNKLEVKLDKKNDPISNFINTVMKRQSLILSSVLLVLLAVGSVGAYSYYTASFDGEPLADAFGAKSARQNEINPQKANQDSADVSYDASDAAGGTELAGMRIAMDSWKTVAEASAALSFSPKAPTKTFDGATLTTIETPQKGSGVTNVDSLYLTYEANNKVIFKVAEVKGSTGAPEEGMQVVTVDGVSGYYYELPNPEEYNYEEGISLAADAFIPRSYLFWVKDSVYYEVAEFGKLSKADLLDLANSFK
jgi:hypothetical protein